MTTPPTLEQIARVADKWLTQFEETVEGLDPEEKAEVDADRATIKAALQSAAKQPEGADWAEAAKVADVLEEVASTGTRPVKEIGSHWLSEAARLLRSRHAPRPDEQHIGEADLNRMSREIACTAQKFKGDYQLTFDAAKVFLSSLLAGQVAGGEDSRERVKRQEFERFYEEGPDKNEEGDK